MNGRALARGSLREGVPPRVRELERAATRSPTDCADDYPLDRRPYRVTLADVDVIRVMY